jgi:transmembrane sensor
MSHILLLLQKLWKGKISDKEAEELAHLLQHHSHELTAELNANFKANTESKEHTAVNHKAQETLTRVLDSIDKKEQKKARVVAIRPRVMWYAAAAIALLIGLAVAFNQQHGKANAGKTLAENAQEPAQQRVVSNSTGHNKEMVLADQTIVTIYPGSSIGYYEPFANNRRDISLTGKALFRVAKDAKRPFTVYAGGMATTALGTAFTVSTLIENKVEVQLFEGRVVVKPIDTIAFNVSDVYLTAGQMATATKDARQMAVTTIIGHKKLPHPAPLGAPAKTVDTAPLEFTNEPLANVFEQLKNRYGATIVYRKSDITALYFTGNALKTDSLKTILSIIANMNGLVYSVEEGKHLIKKNP